jgi:hypothetical protein
MRTQKFQAVIALIIVALAISACGPSEEELAATSAAETAAAASPTPTITPTPTNTPTSTPTPTPTPIPYDLSVLVADDEDAPIVEAIVVLAEISSEVGTQITDDAGQAIWTDLPGETVNLSISAQGYFPTETTETIERGENHVSIVLERDPFGLLSTDVCGPGENILYIEDLQDGHADGWVEIEIRAQGFDIGHHPDEPADNVIVFSGNFGGRSNWENTMVNNVVWRTQFLIDGSAMVSFNWRVAPKPYETEEGTVNDSRYGLNLEETSYIQRFTNPIRSLLVASNPYKPKSGKWHRIEISAYEGELEAWIDGSRILTYNDPDPLPEGGIFLVVVPHVDNTIVYLDDMALCELTAPFVPLPAPESK